MAKLIANQRKDLGLRNGLSIIPSPQDLKKEREDKVIQKLLRNFTFLTQSQLDDFTALVWNKYKRA